MEQKNTHQINLCHSDESQIIQELQKSPLLYNQFQNFSYEWKKRFLDYCGGRKTLPITYDPFFKKIFHPDIHPERLSSLISSLLGIPVKVIKILPLAENMLDGGALLIMDILVELEDGALANVEIQKIPYLFPGERISCYSADLVLRQYSRVKGELGRAFKYGDLKKVYTIVIYEKSTQEFHEAGMHYLHRGKTEFDTGLQLGLLQEYCLLALDVFRENPYPKGKDRQTAWISFLATDSLEMAEELSKEHPWLRAIYEEMAEYLHKPEEVLNMFSEALKMMDHNTVQYMIEQQQQRLDEIQAELGETQGQLSETQGRLSKTQGQLSETQGRLSETQGRLSKTQGQLSETQGQLSETQNRLEQAQAQAIQNTQKAIRDILTLCHELGATRETAVKQLQEKCGLNFSEAQKAAEQFWP